MYRRHNRTARRYRRRNYVYEQAVWPLPAVTGHPPVIITVDQVTHEATLAYGQSRLEDAAPRGDGAPAQPFFMPERTPVIAIKSGVVLSASMVDGVYRVALDHGNGFATDYDGLHEVTSAVRRRVKVGEVIGFIRSSSSAPNPLRFTLSRTDLIPGLPGFPRAVDPLDVLLGTVGIPVEHTSTMPTRKEAA